jgi:hypothetical protein
MVGRDSVEPKNESREEDGSTESRPTNSGILVGDGRWRSDENVFEFQAVA